MFCQMLITYSAIMCLASIDHGAFAIKDIGSSGKIRAENLKLPLLYEHKKQGNNIDSRIFEFSLHGSQYQRTSDYLRNNKTTLFGQNVSKYKGKRRIEGENMLLVGKGVFKTSHNVSLNNNTNWEQDDLNVETFENNGTIMTKSITTITALTNNNTTTPTITSALTNNNTTTPTKKTTTSTTTIFTSAYTTNIMTAAYNNTSADPKTTTATPATTITFHNKATNASTATTLFSSTKINAHNTIFYTNTTKNTESITSAAPITPTYSPATNFKNATANATVTTTTTAATLTTTTTDANTTTGLSTIIYRNITPATKTIVASRINTKTESPTNETFISETPTTEPPNTDCPTTQSPTNEFHTTEPSTTEPASIDPPSTESFSTDPLSSESLTRSTRDVASVLQKPLNRMNAVINVEFDIKLKDNYTDALDNEQSEEFKSTSVTYKHLLTEQFQTVPNFKEIIILGFWRGSIGVRYKVALKAVENNQTVNTTKIIQEMQAMKSRLMNIRGVDQDYVNQTFDDAVTNFAHAVTEVLQDKCMLENICDAGYECDQASQECFSKCTFLTCSDRGECYIDEQFNAQCRCRENVKNAYDGDDCSTSPPAHAGLSQNDVITLGTGLGGAVIIIGVIVAMAIYKRKQRNRNSKDPVDNKSDESTHYEDLDNATQDLSAVERGRTSNFYKNPKNADVTSF